jgi:hypothetical protein
MGIGPKCSIICGLFLCKTCFEKVGDGLFVLRFYTENMYKAIKKAKTNLIPKPLALLSAEGKNTKHQL